MQEKVDVVFEADPLESSWFELLCLSSLTACAHMQVP